MIKSFQKINKGYLLVILIILAVFFLRVYHFGDWLYFQADQTRNANNAVDVLNNGLADLPLLGPKAGGTDFHLGPISYYFEILSGWIFGADYPAVFAFPNLIFLLAAIPLMFYFLRQFFKVEISLLVTAIFSFSYIVTQYSRFSWNPNGLIFFGLLFALSLFKLVIENDKKTVGRWLLIGILSYGISGQLHSLALLGYPLVALVFFVSYPFLETSWSKMKNIFSKKEKIADKWAIILGKWKEQLFLTKINWKYWLGAILILFVMYTPLIIYEVDNAGYNTREFIKAFGTKSEERGMLERMEKTAEVYGENYILALSSFNDKEFKDASLWGCLFIFISIFTLIIWFFRKNKKDYFKKNSDKKFFLLMGIYFFIFLFIHYKLAFDIDQPRFWFPVFFLPYFFLGFLFNFIWNKKSGKWMVLFISAALILLNLSAILNWYQGMKNQDEVDRFGRKITSASLKQNDFIGYGQMKEAAIWIKNEAEKGSGKACFNSPSTYLASYKYIFDNNYPDFESKRINKTMEMDLADNCDIFIIDHGNNSKKEIENKFSQKNINIKLTKNQKFGLITVWKVELVDK